MKLISNNALKYMDIPKDYVIRINLAWITDIDELKSIISKLTHDIFLDYPHNRIKPPVTNFNIYELIDLANETKKIKYLALSNSEHTGYLNHIRQLLNPSVQIVPKIETVDGVNNVIGVCRAAKTKIIMLDKDDLFNSVKTPPVYSKLISKLELLCYREKIHILNIIGVIFSDMV